MTHAITHPERKPSRPIDNPEKHGKPRFFSIGHTPTSETTHYVPNFEGTSRVRRRLVHKHTQTWHNAAGAPVGAFYRFAGFGQNDAVPVAFYNPTFPPYLPSCLWRMKLSPNRIVWKFRSLGRAAKTASMIRYCSLRDTHTGDLVPSHFFRKRRRRKKLIEVANEAYRTIAQKYIFEGAASRISTDRVDLLSDECHVSR